jgi:hypothetical protein
MTELLLLAAIAAAVVFYTQRNGARKQIDTIKKEAQRTQQEAEHKIAELATLNERERKQFSDEIASLARFKDVRDAAATAENLRQSAQALHNSAEREAKNIREMAQRQAAELRGTAEREADDLRRSTNADAKARRERAEEVLASANAQANRIIQDANQRAEQIAGDAYRALKDAEQLKEVATAMRNVIEGYGDRYLKPTYSLLDELAEAYGFDEAGKQLKLARERSKLMVEHERAATCDYVERSRRDTAIRFVIDAFNGKVDSILSRSKADNFGTLEQQIRDAFALVNNNGGAFRNARIAEEYLQARLEELKWAAAVLALREREKEEQRRIREQIREEEKARREIERALKEAAREEEVLQKAMEKVQAQVAKANDAQREQLEAKLAELQVQLAQAEARNQRALSMAQQTKAGHVYVISNVGSFGDDVVKVGMTRRLEPLDRIRELGDASVPFSFDVHAMIWSEDAPGLERALHKHLVRTQVNKVNPRKEFFRVPPTALRQQIEAMGIEATWTVTANAAEYRESLAIEARLRDNPAAAEDWLRHQLDYDPASELVSETEEA